MDILCSRSDAVEYISQWVNKQAVFLINNLLLEFKKIATTKLSM